MLDTDHFVRFVRVDDVRETGRGLLADLHGEQLRVDVVRVDVVRFKISRGGVFDEAPTFAVDVDPLSQPVELAVEREDGVVRVRTARLVVSLWLDPFRLDVHRPDGSPVAETAQLVVHGGSAPAVRVDGATAPDAGGGCRSRRRSAR